MGSRGFWVVPTDTRINVLGVGCRDSCDAQSMDRGVNLQHSRHLMVGPDSSIRHDIAHQAEADECLAWTDCESG